MTLLDSYLGKLFSEKEEIKKLRETNKIIYLYHGTDLKKKDEIKKYGLLPSKQEAYIDIFHNELSKYGNDGKFVWLTSSRKYSYGFSEKTRTSVFDWKKYPPLIVKRRGSQIFYLESTFLGWDEYICKTVIPPKDIIFPGDPLYKKIEDSCAYLKK